MVFRNVITLAFTYVKGECRYVDREGRLAYRRFQRIALLHDMSGSGIDLVHAHLDGVDVKVPPWGPGTPDFLEDGRNEVL